MKMIRGNSNKGTNSKPILSEVEKVFLKQSQFQWGQSKIPYIIVENFPKLGLLTALRFLEWVSENPNGVISLPTGKTPEFFIKWTQYILANWDNENGKNLRKQYGLTAQRKPALDGLQFVQIDEFYPINSSQHNSFYDYVMNYYIKNLGLDKSKALLINCDEIRLSGGKHFSEVFPDYHVDLSLRYRECRSSVEQMQRDSIFLIDQWCSDYEQKIRDKGGIGFFLGGLGPDGHIAFNTRGSDLYSTTRLTQTNFETQAVAATDLGGIEVSSNRLTITIGLETITYNPEAVAIIFVTGESKAQIVKDSIESDMVNVYPATVLQRLKHSKFYLTAGAASRLTQCMDSYYTTGEWTQEKSDHAIVDVCKELDKYGNRLLVDDFKNHRFCKYIPNKEEVVESVSKSIIEKLQRGMRKEENQVFLHTGPHHDDIMLAILPYIAKHIRELSNDFHFAVLTSGFNAVTNDFVIELLQDTKKLLDAGLIQMVEYPDFFESGYKYKHDKDVYHYLNKVAAGEEHERRRGVCHRVVRALTEIYKVRDKDQLRDSINEVLSILRRSYDGEKNPPKIQMLKGMIREFEEELVWAHYGIQVKNVSHLRLGFYKGDIFTDQPEQERDVTPILELFRKIKPTVISLAFDPEGSGPDTHYKVLQATAEALRRWKDEADISGLRIWGYRNVWYRFHAADANVIFPVSLNAMSAMRDAFSHCYISQVDASFPSHELNGKFSDLATQIWVEQLKDIQLLLGKDYFYQNELPAFRRAHGLLYLKEMSVDELLIHARELKKTMEGMVS